MKRFLLFIAILLVPTILYAQNGHLRPLIKENIDTRKLYEHNYLDTNARKYIDYKNFTTIPVRTKKKISRENCLRDFNWDYIYQNKSREISGFYRLLFEKMEVRLPVGEEEDGKWLYFESALPADSVMQFWCDCCEENRPIRIPLTLTSATDHVLNYSVHLLFYDISLNLKSSLKDVNGNVIRIKEFTSCIQSDLSWTTILIYQTEFLLDPKMYT